MPLFTALTRLKADLDALQTPEQEAAMHQQLQLEWSYHDSVPDNPLTLAETRALLQHGHTAAGQPLRPQVVLQNHHLAVLQLDAWLRNPQALTEQFMVELHTTLLGHLTASASPYKTTPNNVLTATGQTLYVTLPQDVPARLAALVAWYRRELAHPTQHPVALAAQLHHRFARIRPFEAGNGRLARLLLNLVLLQHGYPLVVPAGERARYNAASIAAARGEPEPFIQFLSELIAAALRRQLRAAKGGAMGDAEELRTKLALLKQQILNSENAVKTLWDETAQATVYEALVKPWLSDLLQQTQEFDELFMSRSYGGSVEAQLPLPLVLEEVGDWETFEAHLHSALTIIVADIRSVHFTTRWLHFRQRNNGFDVGLRVDFYFRADHFVISQSLVSNQGSSGEEVHWQAEVHQAGYPPAADEPAMREINYQLAVGLYEYIAAQANPSATAT